jgi:hypothetical protein
VSSSELPAVEARLLPESIMSDTIDAVNIKIANNVSISVNPALVSVNPL